MTAHMAHRLKIPDSGPFNFTDIKLIAVLICRWFPALFPRDVVHQRDDDIMIFVNISIQLQEQYSVL